MKSKIIIWTFLLILTGGFAQYSSSDKCNFGICNDVPASDSVIDADGNIYRTVTIGTQTWMAENLKTTRFNDGTSIPFVKSNKWKRLTTPGFCWYDNDTINKNTYGALYNWFAVSTGKLAPKGWHVPTYDDWEILINCLGGNKVAGGKIKHAGTASGQSPNIVAEDSLGFNALFAGYLDRYCDFIGLNTNAAFWSSSLTEDIFVWKRLIYTNNDEISNSFHFLYDPYGISVRCVQD